MVGELLHAGALASTSVAACCVAADRRRTRVRELVTAAVMVLAMADAVAGHGVPAVWWSAAMLAGALWLVVPARRRDGRDGARAMRALDAAGAVIMAALMLLLGVAHDPAASDGAHHGVSSAALEGGLVTAAVGYAAVAVGLALSRPDHGGLLRRVPPLGMAVSVLLMAAALVLR